MPPHLALYYILHFHLIHDSLAPAPVFREILLLHYPSYIQAIEVSHLNTGH